jgi:trehalose 6-phosphate phosphatase
MSFEEVRAHLARAAILLDFDGTLAPIVADPAAARPLPEVAGVLGGLAERAALVAVISGRPEAFIRSVLDAPRVEIVGLYGLADAPPLARSVLDAVHAAAASEPGAEVEDKGVSVAVHVRRTVDPGAAADRLRPAIAAIAAANGLTAFEGKRVIELAPPGSRKRAAVSRLLERVRPAAALYAGDDAEDAEAFAALDDAGIPVCRIVVRGSETPERLIEIADVDVEGPVALLDILRTL